MATPVRREADGRIRRVEDLLARRAVLESEVGALVAEAAREEGAPEGGHPITVSLSSRVLVRMTKAGIFYSFFLGPHPLPHDDRGVYRLPLAPGPNALRWAVMASRTPWAYQIDLLVDDRALMIERGSSAGHDPLPVQRQITLAAV